MNVGENIKKIRKEKGLTQKELGALCGMSESQIRHYELNYKTPRIETIRKIAIALDVSLNVLLDSNNEKTFSIFSQKYEVIGLDNQNKELFKMVIESNTSLQLAILIKNIFLEDDNCNEIKFREITNE